MYSDSLIYIIGFKGSNLLFLPHIFNLATHLNSTLITWPRNRSWNWVSILGTLTLDTVYQWCVKIYHMLDHSPITVICMPWCNGPSVHQESKALVYFCIQSIDRTTPSVPYWPDQSLNSLLSQSLLSLSVPKARTEMGKQCFSHYAPSSGTCFQRYYSYGS
jgi:hypothetical protein